MHIDAAPPTKRRREEVKETHSLGFPQRFASIPSDDITPMKAYKVLLPLATKWKAIGGLLGVEKHVLDRIKSDEGEVLNCLQAMLSMWLKHIDPLPTWDQLADVLDSLDEPQKAQEIREK